MSESTDLFYLSEQLRNLASAVQSTTEAIIAVQSLLAETEAYKRRLDYLIGSGVTMMYIDDKGWRILEPPVTYLTDYFSNPYEAIDAALKLKEEE